MEILSFPGNKSVESEVRKTGRTLYPSVTVNGQYDAKATVSCIYKAYSKFNKINAEGVSKWFESDGKTDAPSDEFWVLYDLKSDQISAVWQTAEAKAYGWMKDEEDRTFFAENLTEEERAFGPMVFAELPAKGLGFTIETGEPVLHLLQNDYLPIRYLGIGECDSESKFEERIIEAVLTYRREVARVVGELKSSGSATSAVVPLHYSCGNTYTGLRFTKTESGISRDLVVLEGLKTYWDRFYVANPLEYRHGSECNSDGCISVFPSEEFARAFEDSFRMGSLFPRVWDRTTKFDRWCKREPSPVREDVLGCFVHRKDAQSFRSAYERAVEKLNGYKASPVESTEGMAKYARLEGVISRFERLALLGAPDELMNGMLKTLEEAM